MMQDDIKMPDLGTDVITLGHGSGGELTHKLLELSIFSLFENVLLQTQHDGAILPVSGKQAFTTDSYVVTPVFFPGGNIGDLAVNGTVNDLAMCGAIPAYLSLSLIIEEGLKFSELWEILISIRNACKIAGVQIVTGDTKVVEKGKGDKIFINTSGIGALHPKADIDVNRIKLGDKVILSGPMASHGISIMLERENLMIDAGIQTDSFGLNHIVRDLMEGFGNSIKLLRDPTRGGVATVLCEIAAQSKTGIQIIEDQLPVNDEVAAACELLGLDPLYVANEGLFIAIVDGSKAKEILAFLHRDEHFSRASVIGEIDKKHPGRVVECNAIGGRRVISMLAGEQLPRIC
jgi:hydrogenase expression/formation protein HypE